MKIWIEQNAEEEKLLLPVYWARTLPLSDFRLFLGHEPVCLQPEQHHQLFWFSGLLTHIGSPGCVTDWLQTLRLLSQHNCVSQFLLINLYIVLFLWRTLIQVDCSLFQEGWLKVKTFTSGWAYILNKNVPGGKGPTWLFLLSFILISFNQIEDINTSLFFLRNFPWALQLCRRLNHVF